MEHVAAISDVEWNSFNRMCHEEADFMAQLLKNCSVPTEVQNNSHYASASTYWPTHESDMNVVGCYESAVYSSDETNTSSHSFLQESSYSTSSGVLFPESYYSNTSHQFFITNDNMMTMDHHNNVMKCDNFLNQDVSNDSDESNKNSSEEITEEKIMPSDMSKKRPRIPRDVQRSKRNTRTKNNVKSDDNEENNSNNKHKNVLNRQSSMASSCSEDDRNASQELSEKTRASRGSATDPQSLYARKRRERINERLKTLQSLVPNGTKVDISTMLEEAVQYVKFLQLQIKLLSSDEHWMYSPIAYNGMDIARFKSSDS